MTSQGVSRKRPAPGAAPIAHPTMQSVPNPAAAGSQLSNDQFLQWGQNPPPTAIPAYPDVNPYVSTAYATKDAVTNASNQLARRPINQQLVGRGRPYGEPALMDHGGTVVTTDQPDSAWEENETELEKRALIAKRDAQAKRKQIPPFVQKLSSFLDESKNTELIRWSDDGNSFIVLDEDEFAKTLIPELFKHNNYASFVRQLNMYGFHKKVGLSDNSMRASERKNKSPSEYSNPYFKRGHPDLLWLIQKPKNVPGQSSKGPGKGAPRVKTEESEENDNDEGGEEESSSRESRPRPRGQLAIGPGEDVLPKDQLSNVYRELQAIRQQQQIISNTISKLRREHEQLYGQAANFQEQHTRHENSINAILTFLATVYNRSLQGHEGAQALANPFAGVIPSDQTGNVVDVDDYQVSEVDPGQRPIKRQPLLLKAPPVSGPDMNRASTMSPSASSLSYEQSPNKKYAHMRKPSVQSGNVEEVFDTSPQGNTNINSQHQPQNNQNASRYPPNRDIMSIIQNSNSRNNLPSNLDFPGVLSSLETSGGQNPLTPNQRADMLRLIANESSHSNPDMSSNNALITPTPPPMPQNYSSRLASTRAEIDNLAKMQAEQDRSVQNLTNLLQPLSPTGHIPGIGSEGMNGNVPPPPLDLDQIFNSGDYFADFPDMDRTGGNFNYPSTTQPNGTSGTATAGNPGVNENDLFDFDSLQADDGNVFGGTTDVNQSHSQPVPRFFDGSDELDGQDGFGGSASGHENGGNNGADGGRIVETFTSSEGTSPANTVDESAPQGNGGNLRSKSPLKKKKRTR